MQEVVIVAATRTAIGSFGGQFAKVPAHELGATVIRRLLDETEIDPASVDEVIFGQVLTAGCGQNPARQAAIHAGLPHSVPALTLNKVCGSGLKALHLAAQAIRCGDAEIMIAGGQESMSLSPHIIPTSRTGQRMGHGQMIDTMIQDGLWDAFNNYHMGITAENLVDKYGITREEQDAFAAASQQKAVTARETGVFDQEITPVSIPQRKGDALLITQDEQPRAGTTAESLGSLKPAFKKDGTVTAANASSISDGASALVLMTAAEAERRGLKPLARIVGHATQSQDPSEFTLAPIGAMTNLFNKTGWSAADVDLFEINEAFAMVAMLAMREHGLDHAKVNIYGGACAQGHPVGSTGSRIIITLINALQQTGGKRGVASLCIGGGEATAVAIELV